MNRLDRWIKDSGLTYSQAGAKAGWSAERMRRYAKGLRWPGWREFEILRTVTNLSVDELLFDD